MPKVTHLIVMGGDKQKMQLKQKPDHVSLLTMDQVETEGFRPENSECASPCVVVCNRGNIMPYYTMVLIT